MKRHSRSPLGKKVISILCVLMAMTLILSACSGGKVKLDPKKPVTISVWHYYNGAILNAFESRVKEFNETVGAEVGIIVECYGMGNVSDLEKAVIASANKEIGSMDMPSIFASYADTAYEAEKRNLLANLSDYFSTEEQQTYRDSFIEEGRIGLNGELRIFPIAKSTEILMVNETDWLPFAQENGLSYDDLSTVEGVVRVAKRYYDWTDAQTPDQPNDGKAFFGRDVMANFFIISSKEFGTEIFNVENGTATIDINEQVMRKIWDNYYVPYINGYLQSYGKFRSDDTKVGDILAYVGSTASASYFPAEVTSGGASYPIQAKILPAPQFEGAEKVMVQQGAGMVVTKSTPEEEYASVLFLKWFTEAQNNVQFAALSGYMPVKKDAMVYETVLATLEEDEGALDPITDETLRIALEGVQTNEMYTNRAFDGGAAARAVLEYHLQDKASADREAVLALIESGVAHDQAVEQFCTDANFAQWVGDLTAELNRVIAQG